MPPLTAHCLLFCLVSGIIIFLFSKICDEDTKTVNQVLMKHILLIQTEIMRNN